MHRELFHIGSLTIYSYGVFLALGFIVATLFARDWFVQRYREPDIILDFVLAAVVGGIVGARLFYVIGHFSDFSKTPGKIFSLNMEGLVFYGGLILGLAMALLVGYLKKVRFWDTMDLAGVCVPVALAIARVGCLLNGCCYGKPTGLPWGITYPASTGLVGARHPTQIYELILDLVLFGLLWWKKDSFEREGTAFGGRPKRIAPKIVVLRRRRIPQCRRIKPVNQLPIELTENTPAKRWRNQDAPPATSKLDQLCIVRSQQIQHRFTP